MITIRKNFTVVGKHAQVDTDLDAPIYEILLDGKDADSVTLTLGKEQWTRIEVGSQTVVVVNIGEGNEPVHVFNVVKEEK